MSGEITQKQSIIIAFCFWIIFITVSAYSLASSYTHLPIWYEPTYICIIILLPIILTLNLEGYFHTKLILAFAASAIISTFYNSADFTKLALYLKGPLAFFLIAWIAHKYITYERMPKIAKFIKYLTFLVTGLVIFQIASKTELIDLSNNYLAFFMLMLGNLLLFAHESRKHFGQYLLPLACAVLIVLLTGSLIMKYLLIFSVTFFMFRRRLLILTAASIKLFSLLILLTINLSLFLPNNFANKFDLINMAFEQRVKFINQDTYEEMIIDKDFRSKTLKYLTNSPLSIFGLGPNSLYHNITKKEAIPIKGELAKIYFETGILGIVTIILLIFKTTFSPFARLNCYTWFQFVSFICFLIFASNNFFLNRPEIIFAFLLFLKIFTLARDNKISYNLGLRQTSVY